MNYGHTKQGNSDSQAFFTSGAGINSDNSPNPESDNSLDLSNDTWGRDIGDTDKRNIGNIAIHSGDSIAHTNGSKADQELGKVIEIEMPPSTEYDTSLPEVEPNQATEEGFNNDVIMTKDRLDPAAVKEIDKAISKLNRTDNVEAFYNDARDAMEANLNHSYNRKLAA